MGHETELRVLLIDDERLLARAAKRMLTLLGVSVTLCSTSSEVMEALADEVYDLILSDVRMPESGPSVVRKIRASGYDGLVVFYSGNTGEFDREVDELIDMEHVTCLLTKPLNFAAVRNLAKLGNALKASKVV